ncbi:MAG: heat shock protein GrpE [Bacteroidetes bacterium ADurb.Bin397]|nr:MAG: heat shock protein GrpE [Bacteroidetes bacterium ADurb.Bin397]
MSQEKDNPNNTDNTIDNEQVTPVGEPFSDEISPDLPPVDEGNDLSKLKDELAESRDKFLRLYSEFDNFRKRTQRERLDLLKSAGADVIIALLPVLDDFDRAQKAFSSTNGDSALKEGVDLIHNKMVSLLQQKGLSKMESVGKEFDVEFHEAITNIPAPTPDLVGKVVDEAESGYLLNGKVIRHAKVIVGN